MPLSGSGRLSPFLGRRPLTWGLEQAGGPAASRRDLSAAQLTRTLAAHPGRPRRKPERGLVSARRTKAHTQLQWQARAPTCMQASREWPVLSQRRSPGHGRRDLLPLITSRNSEF
jgi:hypothetical protein